ncbi:MAG: hypothetical protein ACQER7_05750 [Bacteroidota bacterium]
MMKTRNILTLIVAAVIFSSCSMTLQQRRVADELYQNPDNQQQEEQTYAEFYDEAENVLRESPEEEEVDSVIYEDKTKSSGNPYQDILVNNYDEAYQRRQDASRSLSYGMSDWYGTYYSNDFWYASAYDPSFYNVIVMGDEVWAEPNWLTGHFSTGWKYGSFYNYPYYGRSFMNPYRSTLSMTGIYGFNSMGHGAYGYNAFGRSPFGYSSFGYSPYRYSSFGYGYSPFGYSPYGYSSFGYGSYYGMSPFYSGYNNYYNTLQQQRMLQEYELNDEGRVAKFSNHSQRIRKSGDAGETDNKSRSYIRVQDSRSSGSDERSSHSVRVRRNDERASSKYVKTRNENTSSRRPRYNRPKNEANYEQAKNERVRRQSTNTSDRKKSSTYDNGNSRSSTRSSISSGNSGSSSNSSGSTRSSSGSSSNSGRKRK